MSVPSISVLLPAYNSEAFLAKAIQSVLDQDYRDFELLVINDGSTDGTEAVIRSFTDPRIRYVFNETNSGLIFTLNKGIELAKGKYIARMDADDICLPDRFMQQYTMLENNPAISMVAAPIIFIDENDKQGGEWRLDRNTMEPAIIRRTMLRENCLAHPSIMVKAPVLKKLKYATYQKNIEDYDLWLRMLSRGYQIGKIAQTGLLYRVHEQSITGLELRKKNFFFIHARMKRRFTWHEWRRGRFNTFVTLTVLAMLADLVKGTAKAIKNMFS
jgi:glycosyltransferase involved in cell wall biosynthesis